ncbi:Tcp11-domain-containing protein [Lophium mytilinum]|uniref:Tcp11-domain-containing protein n=1 Tax=Lophium mytilinum TaxID=390894 RepID=A0A6A6QE77_9PEZI|nr:Tcp11-domain-containing protein [Lophium mytilinum]
MSSRTPPVRSNSVNYGAADLLNVPAVAHTPVHTAGVEPSRRVVAPEPYRAEYNGPVPTPNGELHTVHSIETIKREHSSTEHEDIIPNMDTLHLSDDRQLADLIAGMVPQPEGEKLADAFLNAGLFPPITKQSLSELDIHNIINNIKLRHDVNFDRDLSFRPNLDGAKGQEKLKAAKKYWNALTAELELYAFLFQGSASRDLKSPTWQALAAASQKRIPLMFGTIQEILRNLVPERDQARVEENLDVAMLMQRVEKGVCDLVKLSEWLAHLLKEHCAPMRDEWVDKMVESTRIGAHTPSWSSIVKGLRELLGILEAMKLDVANHQIRNLRALLIEDTINFEQKFHLSRIERGRIHVEEAQAWYAYEGQRFRQIVPQSFHQKTPQRAQFEIFIRALLGLLLTNDPRVEMPETFYLDHDRLRTLKSEVHDIVYFEICNEILGELLVMIDHRVSVSPNDRQALRNSIFSVLGEGACFSSRQWYMNRENISVELVRHALKICGYSHTYDASLVREADEKLHQMLFSHCPRTFFPHAARLESVLLPEILDCATSHLHASPMDLFNSLVSPSTPPPPPPSQASLSGQQLAGDDAVSLPADRITDIAQRFTHIAVLHWRVWGPIVYVRPEEPELLSASEVCGTTAELCTKRQSTPGEAIHIHDATCTPVSGTESTSPAADPRAGTRPLASQAPGASTLD